MTVDLGDILNGHCDVLPIDWARLAAEVVQVSTRWRRTE